MEKKPCVKRHIKTIYLRTGKPGDKAKTRRHRFGPEQGSVTFSPDAKAEVVNWTNTRIRAIVPQTAISCRVSVSIRRGTVSNTSDFKVLEQATALSIDQVKS